MTYDEYMKALDDIDEAILPAIADLTKGAAFGTPGYVAQLGKTIETMQTIREAIEAHIPFKIEVPAPAPAPVPPDPREVLVTDWVRGDSFKVGAPPHPLNLVQTILNFLNRNSDLRIPDFFGGDQRYFTQTIGLHSRELWILSLAAHTDFPALRHMTLPQYHLTHEKNGAKIQSTGPGFASPAPINWQPPEYLEIAQVMWGAPLPFHLKTRLTDVATLTRRQCGVLRSRQVIAMILEQYNREQLTARARVAHEKARQEEEK